MKKEFLDHLYEWRNAALHRISELETKNKQPKPAECEGCGDVTKELLEAKRWELLHINKAIEKYLAIHA